MEKRKRKKQSKLFNQKITSYILLDTNRAE